MTRAEFLADLRRQDVRYKKIPDDVLLERYFERYPEKRGMFSDTNTARVVEDLNAAPMPDGWWARGREERRNMDDVRTMESRRQAAVAKTALEEAVGTARAAEERSKKVRELVTADFDARISDAVTKKRLNEKAADAGVPVDKLGEVMVKLMEVIVIQENKKADMELQLEIERRSTEHALELMLTKQALVFKSLTQMQDRLVSLNRKLKVLGTGDEREYIEREIEVVEAQYETRLKQVALEDTEE